MREDRFYKDSLYPSIFNKTLDEEAFVYSMHHDEVLSILKTDKDKGLTQKRVEELLEEHGENKIVKQKNYSVLKMFIDQFKDFMVFLLFIAAISSYIAGESIVTYILFLLIIFNVSVAFIQQYSASRTVEALEKLISKEIKVIRDGKIQKIETSVLVPGDIVMVESGDDIPADCRLIEVESLETLESSITGENAPVSKTIEVHPKKKLSIFDVTNLIFAGTSVVRGRGKAVVVGTGMNTEFGKIAMSAQITTKDKSPLQKETFRAGEFLIIIALAVAVVAFSINFFYGGRSLSSTLILAVGLAVGIVPEGLPSTLTAALAIALRKLSKRNVVVKKLTSTETLGACNVIVSDKTGTLTKNEMTVKKIFYLNGQDKDFDVEGVGYSKEGNILGSKYIPENVLSLFSLSSNLCSNAILNFDDKKNPLIGDPLEGSLVTFSFKALSNIDSLKSKYKRIFEVPFDPERKMMSTVYESQNKKYVFVKGALESIFKISNKIMVDGKDVTLTNVLKDKMIKKSDEFSKDTMRVLALGVKEITGDKLTESIVEKDITIIGIVGILDPPREEVGEAIISAKKAGIKIFMCTGDSPETAIAVSKMINLTDDNPIVITATDIKNQTDEKLEKILKEGNVVFARATPISKLKIVQTLKKMGNIVAVTGDGVNDSPALKSADIGVAMGITGTDVAKESADMILLDDSFASIVYAIYEGRVVYDNIKKFIRFVVTIDVAEMMTIFIGSLLLFPPVMYVLQILTIDLIVNILPSLILASDIADPDIMERPPRSEKNHLFDRETIVPMFINGVFIAIFANIIFYIVYTKFNIYSMATTAAYTTLVISQVPNFLSARSYRFSIFAFKINTYWKIFIGVLLILIVQSILVYTPMIEGIIKTYPLPKIALIFYLFVIFAILLSEEIRKSITRFIENKKNLSY
ncbi:cation-translocating P-type ATPase [Patescibacteria group bacterium]|nr:cation-translocating P-type ATPase [Patescibacteria group bacterium]